MLCIVFYLSFVLVSDLLCWRAVILPCGLGNGGQYFDKITRSCKNCTVGMFREAWQSKPKDCVHDQHKVVMPESELKAGLDSPDVYCEEDVPRSCFSCDKSGRYQGVEGQTACTVCPEHAERPIGSNFTSISDCKEHAHVCMCRYRDRYLHGVLKQVFVKETTSNNLKQHQSSSLAHAVHLIQFAMAQQTVTAA